MPASGVASGDGDEAGGSGGRRDLVALPHLDDLYKRAALVSEQFPEELEERYLPEEKLDTGATATVWRAFDRVMKRDVALKVFDHDNRSLDQVLAEARAAFAVRSEHTVQILDVISGERPAIVMELVAEYAGGKQYCGRSADRSEVRNLAEALRWGIEAARGVHAAHLQGVSHRDIKPRNLVIMPVSRTALVTDFGLAAAEQSSGGRELVPPLDETRRSRHFVGTLEYMAPEQARGIAAALDMVHSADDHRTLVALDVFGLGALIYDLVTGQAPYERAAGESMLDAMDRAEAARYRPLRGLRTRWNRRVPRRLARVIEKAMARDPAARYGSAAALAEDLIRYREHRRTSCDNPLLRPLLWFRRAPLLAVSLVALVAALSSLALARIERDELNLERGEWQDILRAYIVATMSNAQHYEELQASILESEARTRSQEDLARRAEWAAAQQREEAERALRLAKELRARLKAADTDKSSLHAKLGAVARAVAEQQAALDAARAERDALRERAHALQARGDALDEQLAQARRAQAEAEHKRRAAVHALSVVARELRGHRQQHARELREQQRRARAQRFADDAAGSLFVADEYRRRAKQAELVARLRQLEVTISAEEVRELGRMGHEELDALRAKLSGARTEAAAREIMRDALGGADRTDG